MSQSGDYLYMARNNVTRIVNKANPLRPVLTGSYSHPGRAASDVETKGNSMYVVFNDSGTMDTVDITDRANPFLVFQSTLPSGANGLEIVGNMVYVFMGVTIATAGFRGFDITDQSSPPVDLGNMGIETFDYPTNMACAARRCIIGHEAPGTESVIYLDVTISSKPVNLSGMISSTIPSEPRGYSLCGGYAFAASYFETTGAYVMDVKTDETEPRWVENLPMPNPAWVTKMSPDCKSLYVGMADFFGTQDVFRWVNAGDPKNIRFVTFKNIRLPTNIMGMAVDPDGRHVYLGGRHTNCSLRVLEMFPNSGNGMKSKFKGKK